MWYRTFAVNTSERALPWHTVKGVEYVCTTFINVSWRVEESSERLNKAPASCELFTCSCVKRKMACTQCPFMLCSTTNSVPTFSQPYLRDEETQTEKCPTSCHFWSPDVVFFSFSLSKMWERWGEKKNKKSGSFWQVSVFCSLLEHWVPWISSSAWFEVPSSAPHCSAGLVGLSGAGQRISNSQVTQKTPDLRCCLACFRPQAGSLWSDALCAFCPVLWFPNSYTAAAG